MAKQRNGLVWLGIALLVYTLLIGVGVIGDGFKWISGGSEGAKAIFSFASDPIVGVILGILATALVQSSSTVTSVIVALVAGGVPVSLAIPMIMGANMGTTITNTIVSLGNIKDKDSFSKSFQAATVHDFFNLYTILIFLPIEVLFHPLEKLSGVLASIFSGGSDASISGFNIVSAITKPISHAVIDTFKLLPETFGAVLSIIFGVALIIFSVLYLGNLLQRVMQGEAKRIISNSIGRGPISGISAGAFITVLVQSSSTTTSLVVPLAGAGVLTTKQVFPFTMGANIGTTITALLAATAISGETQVLALQIALVHFLYNVFGVTLFSTVPLLNALPLRSAKWLGEKTKSSKLWAFGYIFGVFFIIPSIVFALEEARIQHNEPSAPTQVVTKVKE